jgi:hypothetical protein
LEKNSLLTLSYYSYNLSSMSDPVLVTATIFSDPLFVFLVLNGAVVLYLSTRLNNVERHVDSLETVIRRRKEQNYDREMQSIRREVMHIQENAARIAEDVARIDDIAHNIQNGVVDHRDEELLEGKEMLSAGSGLEAHVTLTEALPQLAIPQELNPYEVLTGRSQLQPQS